MAIAIVCYCRTSEGGGKEVGGGESEKGGSEMFTNTYHLHFLPPSFFLLPHSLLFLSLSLSPPIVSGYAVSLHIQSSWNGSLGPWDLRMFETPREPLGWRTRQSLVSQSTPSFPSQVCGCGYVHVIVMWLQFGSWGGEDVNWREYWYCWSESKRRERGREGDLNEEIEYRGWERESGIGWSLWMGWIVCGRWWGTIEHSSVT